MTNEEKSQEIVNKHFEWISNFVEENNLSKEDRNNIRYKMYSACQEIAEWKDSQPEIIEIFGKRVKIVEEKEIHYTCKHCCFDMECRKIKGLFKDSMICKDSNKKLNRHFVEVDEDGNEIKR